MRPNPFVLLAQVGCKSKASSSAHPTSTPQKIYPLKFLIHGGPQGAWGDAWSYRWNAELMAASGYIVVMINPRGSTGYGQAFIDGINGDWGGKPYVDLMKGLDYAEAKYPFIDKKRECALGASYGGFMANWILTHTNRFACIVTHDGMFNPQSAYGTTEELWFNEWEFRRPGASEPGQPWKYASGPIENDPFRKWSPMLSIQNAKTPTLVIHSQRDYRLDVSEGFQLFTRPSAAERPPARCSTSPTKATGSRNPKTPSSGTKPSATGATSTPTPTNSPPLKNRNALPAPQKT